jgi:UPF0716 protein FxsA
MRRFLLIVGILILVPIIEIAVLIGIGQVIGPWWTVLLVLTTSALGGWLLRREGPRAWRTFQDEISAGRPPGNAATEGLLVLLGGIFMLVPGFFSDIVGGLLLLPPTRRVARVIVLNAFAGRMSPTVATTLFGPRRVRARSGAAQTAPADAPGPAYSETISTPIEGEIIDPR